MTPERQGQRVAWILFGLIAAVHVAVLVVIRLQAMPGEVHYFPLYWALVMWYTLLASLVLMLLGYWIVPRPSRQAFKLTAWLAFGILMGLSGVSCFVVAGG